ncbi:MAG: hypothetical protein HYR55_12645 [Acidobacteria bacterium]|nr:hypothetical protein [Acidobacteriota bacterium]MBI3656517.1 hypothetical protein [Acidobacteriota bacterium]
MDKAHDIQKVEFVGTTMLLYVNVRPPNRHTKLPVRGGSRHLVSAVLAARFLAAAAHSLCASR